MQVTLRETKRVKEREAIPGNVHNHTVLRMELLVHVYRLKHKGLLIQVSILLTYLCLHVCVKIYINI